MNSFLDAFGRAPSEAWVGLLGVLCGGVLTILGVWLTSRASAKQLKMQLMHEERLHQTRQSKDRLEELYILVCAWQSGMVSNFLNLTLFLKGHTDYNQYLDSVIAAKPPQGTDFSRLEMIIGIYGSQVSEAYAASLKVREKINEIIAAHKASYLRGEPGRPYLAPLTQAYLEFNEVCDDLKTAIARSARGDLVS